LVESFISSRPLREAEEKILYPTIFVNFIASTLFSGKEEYRRAEILLIEGNPDRLKKMNPGDTIVYAESTAILKKLL